MTTRMFLSTLALLLAATVGAFAQPSDTITANPKAVKLHAIWKIVGQQQEDRVGLGAGNGGDVNSDSLGDFAVFFPRSVQWHIYYGHALVPDTQSRWSFHGNAGGELPSPVVGDFWGTGHKAVGFAHDTCNFANGVCLLRIYIYRTESGHLADTAAVVVNTNVQFCTREAIGADLDADGADELLLVGACYAPEIWIYRGGSAFRGDTPTMILRDADTTGAHTFHAIVADIDGDGRLDLVTGGEYRNGPKLKFYWGSPTSPWSWSKPDRIIDFGTGYPDIFWFADPVDADGDRVADVLIGNSLYRSGAGKNARTRSYTISDADQQFTRSGFSFSTGAGYLNDSSRTYQMIATVNPGHARFDGSEMLLFSGEPDGPDAAYDASISDNSHILGYLTPLKDCNGDGWDDFLTASPDYYGWNNGIAMVLSGGPEIPRDFTTSGVQEVAVAGRADGLLLWPNPVVEELNIAWRGNLRQMPSRFAIHDLLGRRIAGGWVESWRGQALWHCADVPAGTYLLSVFDAHGTPIASARIIKQ